ncbi:MAG TPA: Vms1/Ankzf1 family peptidyl-tRNA hydrolase [Thermoleophilaceae bacterium]|jgi:peptide subunit release factor 1 (eRF1)|nr:Vms1/Ankzf1 family peptidyl-tRNA hydrolase [Thermoleophilaceae bacterium]
MQTNQLSPDTLRRLAELRPDDGKVVSIYLNLDPTEFASGAARSTAINSLLDEAGRAAREEDPKVREDVERIRDAFKGMDFQGAHAVAVFAAGGEDLLEVIKLPRTVDSAVVIDEAPYIEPLVEVQSDARYGVVLVNRQTARIFRGSRDRLDEVGRVYDEVHRRHDQGGWSQARYQRSVDKEAQDHLKNAADELLRRHKRRPFEALFVGAPEAVYNDFRERLHPYLSERVVGRIEVDVEHTGVDEVQHAAEPAISAYERKLEKDALDRLEQARGTGGRGATGLEDTLAALSEQRVEVLLLQENFDAAGVCCPQCGWLGPSGVKSCPADGTTTVEREDITDLAVRRAITQSAQVVRVRDDDRLEPMGSIAAVLRF